MARAAVIPGVSATDVPSQRATRGRGRTPTTSTTADAQDTKSREPAKRGRKPGKTITTATVVAKDKKSNDDMEEEGDDDLSFDVGTTTTKTTAKKTTKSTAASKSARSIKKTPAKSVAEVEDNVSSEEDDDDDELADFEVTKKKAGRPAKAKSAPTTTTKSTRGRPKTAKPTEQQKEQDVVSEKKTRGRRPAAKQTTDNDKTIYVATGSTMSSLAKARSLGDPAKKKKVTFADLTDSDNEVSEVEEQKPATKSTAKKATAGTKSSGLKAKPVRKAGTATRGRPPKSQTAAAAKPLSPKKATQLAKGSSSSASSGDEDELAREKTFYSLVVQKSPMKKQEPQHTGLSSPVKRIMLPGQASTPARPPSRGTTQDENSVPSLPNPSSTMQDSMFMGSPARRPPPSTSKETIRDTPRRGPLFISHPSASKLSTTEPNPFMQNMSPLKASPKKGGNLAASFMSASPEKGSSTPFNAKLSLLKSPAKRIQSPFVFQKSNESKPLKAESSTAGDDVDTEMCDDDDDDVFVDDKADDLSDDELSMDMKAVRNANDDDVFVDHPVEQEQSVDEVEALDVDEEVEAVEILEDPAEVVQKAESVHEDVHEDVEDQTVATAEEEDVEMSQDEPDVNDENLDPEDVEDHEVVLTSKMGDNVESDAEMEEDVPEPNEEQEHCDNPSEDFDIVQPATEEIVEQAPRIEQQDVINDDVEQLAESENASNEVVIHAEPEDELDDTLPEVDTPCSNTTIQSARSSIDPRDVVRAGEVDEVLSVSTQGTPRFIPPAAPSPPVASPMRHFNSSYRDHGDDMSEYGSSPASRRQSIFSNRSSILPHSGDSGDDTFTSLAAKLDSWKASSPAKQRSKSPQRSIFSPVVPRNLAAPRRSMQGNKYGQIQSMRQSLAARHSLAKSVVMDGNESDTVARQSPEKDASDSVVGGEAQVAQSETNTAKPQNKPPRLSMSITPVRVNRDAIRTVHTVSKVPLKPEADESPIKYPRKRARSMSIDIQLPIRASPGRVKLAPKSRKSTTPDSPTPTPTKRNPLAEIKDTPESEHHAVPSSTTASPVKTPHRDIKVDQQCLRGAVVLVDVHTTEGEDASGIFVELLTQMGAKCVKSWSWNPRSSQSPGVDGSEVSSKVGITHVVYKDGGVRTMEKVRQAGELVKCVGVGWVLDCERANKWVDEAHYYVDSTIIPRGGAKRRKSMQPRALANVNGSLHSSTSSSSSSSSSSIGHGSSTSNRRARNPTDLEDTMQDFRRMSPNSSVNEHSTLTALKTPTSAKTPSYTNNNDDDEEDSEYNFNFNFDFSAMSPATPGFLRLTQQTCPPKQSNQGLFSSMLSDSNRPPSLDDSDGSSSGANLRAKLEAARRKSLAFKPRFGSPLSRS